MYLMLLHTWFSKTDSYRSFVFLLLVPRSLSTLKWLLLAKFLVLTLVPCSGQHHFIAGKNKLQPKQLKTLLSPKFQDSQSCGLMLTLRLLELS